MSNRLAYFCLGSALVAIALVHGPILGYATFANVDEAYAMALAERLLEGHKLYEGAVSQRGPLMYYLFEAIAWAHGWDNVVAVRVYALLLSFAHVLLVFWAGRALLGRTAAVIAATVTGYALAFGFPPQDGAALHGEPLQLPAMMAGVVWGAAAVRRAPGSRGRRGLLAAAGLALGAAFVVKQSVALHFLPIVAWLAVDAGRRRALRTTAIDAACLGAAMAVVPLAFGLHAWAQGTLRELLYYTVTYNRDVHLKPTTQRFAWLPNLFFGVTSQTLFVLACCLLAGLAFPRVRTRLAAAWRARSLAALGRGFGPRHYVALHLALGTFAASAMWRFFPHYFLQPAPFLALAIGAVAERWVARRDAGRAALATAAAFNLAAGGLGCVFGEKVDGRVGHDRTVQDIGKYVSATTRPEDRIFVWGFSPWVYQYAHRRPAGRFVFHTYVTGLVPWFWEKLAVERARIVPGSQEALLADLERERPEIVVDAGSIMMARSLRLYEPFARWLRRDFCFEVRLGAFDVYRRKPQPGPCAQPWFPLPAGTQDWNGRGLPIPVPRTVDWDRSAHLPFGSYFKPVWFTDGPAPPAAGLAAVRDAKRDKEEAEGRSEGFVIFDLEPGSVVLPKPPPEPPDDAR